MHFNVLTICNNTSKPITGDLAFSCPDDWKIIAFPIKRTTINPGDTVRIPIRVNPSTKPIGGITYIVSATFRTIERLISASTYLTLPAVSKWDFSINNSKIYFTENSPFANFKIYLSNKGNTNELIKVNLKPGRLLTFIDGKSQEYTEYVEPPAYKDTVITHIVSYQKNLNYAEKTRYESNWKESAVRATASTESIQKSAEILFRKLYSAYVHQRAQNTSPLNIDFQTYNLMSSQQPRSNFRMYGSILFPENRELRYMTGLQNIGFNKKSFENFNVNQQVIYSLNYFDSKSRIELGYNVNSGSLHTLNGRGLAGTYRLNQKNTFSYGIIQNPYSKNFGQNIGFATHIGKVALNTELTHENNPSGSYDATSFLLGSSFKFLKYHSLSLQVLGSQAKHLQPSVIDTTVLGFSFRADYRVKYKKFEMRLNTFNSSYNYIRNSGLQQYYLDSKYRLNNRTTLSLYGNRQYYSTTRYPYNFYNLVNYNSTDYLRFTTTISSGNLTYQMGPSYNGSVRQYHDRLNDFNSEYKTYQPGVWGSVTFKLGNYRSITPNLSISNLRLYYNTSNPDFPDYSSTKNVYYAAGLSYFDHNWRVNAYYTSGSASDLYRSVIVDTEPVMSRSIQFRPSYENFFFDRTLKVSAFLNYAYYMPSERENISYNVKLDQYFKNGWILSLSGFMYSNSRGDKDVGELPQET